MKVKLKSEIFSAITWRNLSDRLLGILDLSEFGFRLWPPIDRCGGDGRPERADGGGAVQCNGVDWKTGVEDECDDVYLRSSTCRYLLNLKQSLGIGP
ncbi:hypothetical protein CMV_006203 [Castanea mollissima]|uniref:Uncharacterized protein n=1 Tax=Castanea mollissima TaxID=60419 RepID=A0A8J4RRD7_9ROSI|nr:hypothetical protein CMV_006203 [Castanea mollissima]